MILMKKYMWIDGKKLTRVFAMAARPLFTSGTSLRIYNSLARTDFIFLQGGGGGWWRDTWGQLPVKNSSRNRHHVELFL